MTIAEAIVEILKALRVKHVFGVSGANIEHFHDAIYRLGDGKIDAILAKHETAAAFMADGAARTHNTLGVCCATSGGGMMNLAVGIAEAYADGTPILAIIGQPPTALEGRGAFQDSSGYAHTVNAVQLFEAISKSVIKLESTDTFWQQMQTILSAIFDKRYGPSVLLVPRDLFSQEVSAFNIHEVFSIKNFHSISYRYSTSELSNLVLSLKRSKNTLVLLGNQIKYTVSPEVLDKFSRHFGCHIATSLADVSGEVQESNYYLGQVGICGQPEVHKYIRDNVDLVLVIDNDLGVMSTAGILDTINNKECIFIGRNASMAQAAANINQVFEGDTYIILQTLITQSSKITFEKANLKIAFTKPQPVLLPMLKALQPYLNTMDTVYFDAGDCVATAAHYLRFPNKAKSIIALGMGNMGYAIPASIGAQLSSPKKQQSMVFVGDGGFLMSGFEIHTAVEYDLPILFVVFNNNKHGMCATRQKVFFDNRIIAANFNIPINIAAMTLGLCDTDNLWSAYCDNSDTLTLLLEDYYQNNAHKTGVLELKIHQDDVPPFTIFAKDKSTLN